MYKMYLHLVHTYLKAVSHVQLLLQDVVYPTNLKSHVYENIAMTHPRGNFDAYK